MKRLLLPIVVVLVLGNISSGQNTENAFPRVNASAAEQLLQDARILSADDMQGRKPDTPGSARARAYILKRFKEIGLKWFDSSYLQNFQFSYSRDSGVHQGVNVAGYVEGIAQPQRFLIVTAHYDHLGVRGDQIYNGADDNASGVAALFAFAKYFHEHPPAGSIIFVAFDAEEGSRNGGAYYFITHAPVNLEAIVMNVNVDMIGRDANDVLYAVGTYHYPFLKPYLEEIGARSHIKLRFGHDQPGQANVEDWTTESDHIHFHAHKIPFIYFGVEDNEQHHQPTDDFETLTAAFYINAVETIIDAIKQFDSHLVEIEKQRAKVPQNSLK